MLRLNFLELNDHPILQNLKFEFCQEDPYITKDRELFSSIIIGPNGTGKSTVLKIIAEIFREISLLKQNHDHNIKLGYRFRLRYSVDGNLFEIASSKLVGHKRGKEFQGYTFFLNNHRYPENDTLIDKIRPFKGNEISISDLILPSCVLASSLMLTDKFNAKSAGIYKYLGVRNENSPSSTGTRTYVRKTVDNIVDGFRRKNFAQELNKLFDFLELDSNLTLSYIPRYRWAFYQKDISVEKLFDLFENKWKELFRRRNSPLWGAQYFSSIKEDVRKLERIVEFLKSVHEKVFVGGNNRSLDYDVINQDLELLNDYDMITELRRLDILSYPELNISKNNKPYSFITSSSGEAHIISDFIGILSQIQHNSIILIDEPEISLHPNWQIQYIDYLKKIFHDYPTAHFVIATHSHFLLSNVKQETSSAVALEKDNENKINTRTIDFSTFGWSPENILYNVFRVSATRNTYFEMDVQKLLHLVSSNSKNREEMLSLISKLNNYTLSNDDPLVSIIAKAQNYVENEI